MSEKVLIVGMKVEGSAEARQQGINIPIGAKLKYSIPEDEIVTIEFTRKSGKRATERIPRDFLQPKVVRKK